MTRFLYTARQPYNRPPMRVLFLFCALLLVSLLTLGHASAQVESAAFPVAQLDASARTSSMGGHNPALVTRGTGGLFVNPALLDASMHGTAEFTYLNHVSDISGGWLSYARTVEQLGTAAIGIRYMGFGDLDRLDASGNRLGSFNASDVGLTLSLSRSYSTRLQYGANLNWLHNSIDSEGAQALTLDVGALYHDAERRFSAGISLQHAGVVLSSIGSRRDDVPTDLRIGITKRLEHLPVLFSVTAYRLHDPDGGPDGTTTLGNIFYHIIPAAEFQFSEGFRVRLGYNHRRHDELKIKSRLDLAGVSTGVGVRVRRVSVDYGFTSWSSLGGLHRITIQTAIR